MATINYDEIANKIINASKAKSESTNNKNILKLDDIGNIIIGRFLPYLPKVENSEVPCYGHGWKSKLDESNINVLCPNSYGEKCPICRKSVELWKSSDVLQKKTSEPLRRRQNWLANFYVISDLKHPENNGVVKILKMGQQLHRKFEMAISGEDKDIYGAKVWRLDEQGCSFRILTKPNTSKEGEKPWPFYGDSGFLPAAPIPNMTPDMINKILDMTVDLTSLYKRNTWNELEDLMNKHYFTNDTSTSQETVVKKTTVSTNNNITPSTEKNVGNTVTQTTTSPQPTDDELDMLLADVQNNK